MINNTFVRKTTNIVIYIIRLIYATIYDWMFIKEKSIPSDLKLYFLYYLSFVHFCWLMMIINMILRGAYRKYNTLLKKTVSVSFIETL